MPANFTRRRDLFIDPGIGDPEAAIAQIRDDADAIGLADLIVRHGYEIRFHEPHDHWSYSERGERDVFHYAVCSPRK